MFEMPVETDRLKGVLDSELGPASTPSWQDARVQNNQRALGPFYERSFEGHQPPIDVNVGLKNRVDEALLHAKGEKASTLQKIRDALLMQNGQPDISARGVLETRQALDLLSEQNATNPKVRQIVGGYRATVDAALKDNVSRIGRLDRAYGEMANQREMLDTGQSIFNGDRASVVRPEELQTLITNNRPASNRMLSAGARAELDRIVGTNSNDMAALNNALKGNGDWNRDKLRLLFGQDKADRVLQVLDNETAMSKTRNAVVGGSPTAMTREYSAFLRTAGQPTEIDPKTSLFGLVGNLASKAANKVTGNMAAQRQAEFADQMARLSVAPQGQAVRYPKCHHSARPASEHTSGCGQYRGRRRRCLRRSPQCSHRQQLTTPQSRNDYCGHKR